MDTVGEPMTGCQVVGVNVAYRSFPVQRELSVISLNVEQKAFVFFSLVIGTCCCGAPDQVRPGLSCVGSADSGEHTKPKV